MKHFILSICLLLIGSVSLVQAQTQSGSPDYDAILRLYNQALDVHDDKCGYRIGNSVWAIGGGKDEATGVVAGEFFAFDGGQELRQGYRLTTDGQELTLPGRAHDLFLRRSDGTGALTFRVCSLKADGSQNCTIFGDTYHICFLYG